MFEKIVVVTRKTRLQELIARFNTRGQARFYIQHSGGDFEDYEIEDETYYRSLDSLRRMLDFGLKVQVVDREFLPNFIFGGTDLVVAVGQDGLVANTAKYVGSQPLLGVNPDPLRYDGILVRLYVQEARHIVESVLSGRASFKDVTLAEAVLNDGQRLLAFNDLFIGARTHISARYKLQFEGQSESQSSSGLIVSTGAGSTGWLSSVFNMVSSVSQFVGGSSTPGVKLSWDSTDLIFVVREPFISRHSSAGIVAGRLHQGAELVLESQMPSEGTIFSDGIESDYLSFNAGGIAHIRAASQTARLVLPARETSMSPALAVSRRGALYAPESRSQPGAYNAPLHVL
jgi:NAD kinase